MHIDLIGREAPLHHAHAWFLEAYEALLADPGTAPPDLVSRLAVSQDEVEAALALFLFAHFADAPGLAGAGHAAEAAALANRVAARLAHELRPGRNGQADTWVLALFAAALRAEGNRSGRRDREKLLAGVKNHLYRHHTRGGTLMASSDRQTLDYSVLLAAVPFGIFDPEDLALVEAVRILATPERLAAASPAERQLLAWYWSEQGSYAKARALNEGAGALGRIVSLRLENLGQLAPYFIRHAPDGNGNRYEPLPEERWPKLVTAEDEVLIRAVAAPLADTEPLELVLGDGGERISGIIAGGCWEFAVPPRPAGTVVDYCIRFAGHPEVATPNFSYEVLTRRPGAKPTIHPYGETIDLDIVEVTELVGRDGSVRHVELAISCPPSGIFGLGERYNALDQAGNRVDQFVYNQYKNQGLRTYMPMPVFYTDAGWGLHIRTDSYSWFDFSTAGVVRLGVEAPSLSLDLFSGSVAEQVSQFMTATGEPEAVPLWALGPWMSSNNWDSDAEVRRQVALTEQHGVPATVLVIEAWSDEATFYIFNDAQYEGRPGGEVFTYEDFSFPEWGRWPDPKGLVEHLHAHGLRLVLWQIPIIKQAAGLRHAQKQRDEEHFIARGYGVQHPDGTPLRLPEGWFKDSLLMDFTNPEAVAWWFAKRQYLNELGVDGYKTDGGEMVWGRELRFADGSTGLTGRNRYPRDYISAYYRFAQQNGGICFSRAGYTGAQTFPAHWAGDERSTWDAFKRSLLAGLSAGMSGVIFWGWDLAGFSGEVPGAELYIRSAQMAAFCPIMQYHAESKAEFNQDRTPWNIAERSGDPRALTLYAFYANLRMQLLPYLGREAAHCVAAKTPLMRAMLLDHQADRTAVLLWDQYGLGRDLLVAPVIEEGATGRRVYLPAGRWWHLLQNRWFEAGWHEIEAPLEQIPVFVRAGALLPLGFDGAERLGATMPPGLSSPRRLVLLFAVSAGAEARYEDNGWSLHVRSAASGDVEARLDGSPPAGLRLALTDGPAAATLNGRPLGVGEAGPHWVSFGLG